VRSNLAAAYVGFFKHAKNEKAGIAEKVLDAVICRVARWFVFKPKIPIWVNFGGQ
jgi:hypothetical protein